MDLISTIEKIYNISPALMQDAFCTAYGALKNKERNGSQFLNYYYYLLKNEFNSKEEIISIQEENLRRIIKYVYFYNPYYKEKFKDINVDEKNIFKLIETFPLLSKELIISNKEKLISLNSRGSLIKNKTSGSTGKSLSFYTTKSAIAFQWAIWWRYRRRFCFLPKQWHVNFTGKPIIKFEQSKPPFWRVDYARKQIIICASQLNNKKIKYILDFLNRKKINVFTGYPSIISQFCELIIKNSLSLDYRPALVTLGAEKCFEFQRQIISKVTGAFITDQYGLSEGCANLSRCIYGNYHEDSEFCYLECHDRVDNQDGSYTGKIVATGFSNTSFPFIRYLTGDTATWAPQTFQCPCGRKSKVIFDIEGRVEDYVLTSDGSKFMRFDYIFKETSTIKEAQVIQKKIDQITIRYVPRNNFKNDELDKISILIKKYISNILKINFEKVEKIERSQNGKFKAVISEIHE